MRMLFGTKISNKFFHSKKYFLQLLLYFLMLATVIMLSTSIFFTRLYTNNVKELLSVDYTNNITRVGYEFDNLFAQYKNLYSLLIQHPDINDFLITTDSDLTVFNRALSYLTSMKNVNPYLYSLMLYNENVDYVLTTASSYREDLNQFLDGSAKPLNTKSDLNLVASVLNRGNIGLLDSIESISIIFPDSYPGNTEIRNAVIINIDRYELEAKLLASMEGVTIIVDNSGKVLFDPYRRFAETSIGQQTFFQEILKSNFYKGSFENDQGESEEIITYTKSIATGLYIVNIRSIDNYTDVIKKKITPVIFTCLVILAFFFMISYAFSKKVYKPIKIVTESFAKSKYGKSDDRMGELATISKIYEDTMHHLYDLEVKSMEDRNKLKEVYLRSLLKSDYISGLDSADADHFEFGISFENLILISMNIDMNIDEFKNAHAEQRSLHTIALCRIIPEILKNNFRCEVVDMLGGEVAVLLNYRDGSENNFNTLLDSLHRIRELFKKISQITLTVGIGGVANSAGECAQAYQKAVDMAQHRFVLGVDKIIYKNYLDEVLSSNHYYPQEIEDKLVSAIHLNKKETFMEDLEDLVELVKTYCYSDAVSTFFCIATACIKAINQTVAQNSHKFFLNFNEFRNIFSELITIDQAKAWLINLFDEYQQIVDQINDLKNHKHYNFVKQIEAYIQENFHDCNLSANSIADIVGYTPYYFSKIFKEMTGMNISDYIRQIRINKAKELLDTTDYKVNEISNMLGFTNVSNFYLVFKKDIGLTPSAYREYAASKNT